MARSTSKYGKTSPARPYGPQLAAHGLCSIHRFPILSDLTCWECGPDVIARPYAPEAPVVRSAARELADTVRAEIAKASPEIAEAIRGALNTARSKGELDTATLTSALEVLRACAGTTAPAPAPATPPAPTGRTNKFAGKCAGCGGWVEAETGTIEKVDGKWLVRHAGTCPEAKASPAPVESDVADGYYAIESTGDNDLVFYRVTSSEKWGRSVQMIVGGHADTYVARKAVPGILARIAADEGAAKRYADEIGNCYRCNRTLTDEASRAAGIGPVCAAAE